MDPIIGTIIVAVIGGIFSIITLKVQKSQNNIMERIDEQSIFIDKEKEIRQKLIQAEKKRSDVIEQMTILSMKINIHLIKSLSDIDENILNDLKLTSIELEKAYKNSSELINDISKEYDILISISKEYK